jgi:hypothetical protein
MEFDSNFPDVFLVNQIQTPRIANNLNMISRAHFVIFQARAHFVIFQARALFSRSLF